MADSRRGSGGLFWILRIASLLVPPAHRTAWIREWRGECAAARADGRFRWNLVTGAFADAWAMRRSRPSELVEDRTARQQASYSPGGLAVELKHAARIFRRAPGFTLAGVLTLGLGLGATAAIFTVVDIVLLRPLPYPDAERVVRVEHNLEGQRGVPLAPFEVPFFESENRSFEAFGAHWDPFLYTLAGDGRAERVDGVMATTGLLEVLGATTVAGRLYTESDAALGEQAGVIISHRLWVRRYGEDPTIAGRTIEVQGRSREVLGVMAPEVDLPRRKIDLWVPYMVPPGIRPADNFRLYILSRLRAGVDVAQARVDLTGLTARLPELAPFFSIYLDQRQMTTEIRPIREEVVGEVERPLWVMLGAVSTVLLVAIANVATLFLVRAESRGREIAIRKALGAGRTRLIGHFLSESLCIAAAGGLLGLGLAWAGLRVFTVMAPPAIPRLDQVAMSWTTLALIVGLALAIAGALSFYPYLRFGRGASAVPSVRIVGEGRQTATVGAGFVIVQVALALVLLSGSALLVQTFRHLRAVDPGFEPEGVLMAEVSLTSASYPTSDHVSQFRTQLLEMVERLPGVRQAALGPSPLSRRGCSGLHVESVVLPEDQFPPCMPMIFVSSGYWELLGMRLESGRLFTRADLNGPPVVVVTANSVPRLWPDGDPLLGAVHPSPRRGPPWFPVAGVTAPVRGEGPDQPLTEAVYFPIGAMDDEGWLNRNIDILLKTLPGAEATLIPALRDAISRLDPNVPVTVHGLLEDELERTMVRSTFTLFLLGTAATTALVLGLVGLYGVVAHRVEVRRNEIGVRIVVGARAAQVRNMVLGHSLRLVLAGTGVGLIAAVLLTRTLSSLLFGVQSGDPVLLGLATVALLVSAAAASWLPAHKATRIDPATVLRSD